MKVYVSHGARLSTKGDVKWWVVEPQHDPERLAVEVESLRRLGRTVIELEVVPRSADHSRVVVRQPLSGWVERARVAAQRIRRVPWGR